MVVAHHREHPAVTRSAGEVGVADGVDAAVEARPLAVPDREHPVETGAGEEIDLLGAPAGGGGEVLVHRGLEVDIGPVQETLRAPQLLVRVVHRRAAVTGDEAAGMKSRTPVTRLLHQREAHQGLAAGEVEGAALALVAIVEACGGKRHQTATSMRLATSSYITSVAPPPTRWARVSRAMRSMALSRMNPKAP